MTMPFRRQQDSNNRLVTRRRGYLTILLDTDDNNGGYPLKTSIVGKVWAAIEGGRDTLYGLGFEDIVVEEIPPNENYESESQPEISRGVLMIAFTVYPEIRR